MTLGKRWWCWSIPLLLAAGCANADEDDNVNTRGGLAGEVCGFEVLPSPLALPASACEEGQTIYGPVRFEREKGKPMVESATFDVTLAGGVCLSVRSGEDGENRISSGSVQIDGDAYAVPSDFNQQSDGVEREIALEEGTHSLEVDLASMPESFVEIEVRESFGLVGDPVVAVSDDGTLELSNLATGHPLVTPNGDGHHDTTHFNADVEPLINLPGKDAGTDYFFEWEFVIVDLDSCAAVDTGITGTTQVNSPTNIRADWDGTDVFGATVPNGTYAYYFEARLVDEDGVFFGELTESASPKFGLMVDSTPLDFDEAPEFVGSCVTSEDDGIFCGCPEPGGIGFDPNCSQGDDHPLHPTTISFEDPSTVPTEDFITTTFDSATGRYTVVVDVRTFNRSGLVPQRHGDFDALEDEDGERVYPVHEWEDEADLRQWISDMTGVPVGTGDSLFNFDYVQLGTTTAFTREEGIAPAQFNHFLLDAITDKNGNITVNGVTTDVDAALNGAGSPAPQYQVTNPRVGDECTNAGNTNGESTLTSKMCAFNEGIPVGGTSAGIYMLRSSVFDLTLDGETTTQDEQCVVNAFFSCAIRTFRVPIESIEIEASYYVENGGVAEFAFADSVSVSNAHAASLAANRQSVDGNADGVCTRSVALHDGIRVRMDSADGTVSDTCVVNSYFP